MQFGQWTTVRADATTTTLYIYIYITGVGSGGGGGGGARGHVNPHFFDWGGWGGNGMFVPPHTHF